MSMKAVMLGMAGLVSALPAAAQDRGTVEFGAFGSAASFDRALTLQNAYGGGGRVGIFLDPRLAIEFENAEMRASRPNGLKDVNVGVLSGRLVATAARSGPLSLLVGGGAGVSTETNFMHSYGVDALVGARFALGENAAIRVDGVWDWLANEDWKSYRSVRLGMTLYRHANRATRLVSVTAPMPALATHRDSVSAAETRRLRDRDAALDALRDSLRSASVQPVSAEVATIEARIHFAFDRSDLTDSARVILDETVLLFRANPGMSVVLGGYTDVKGSDAYNMALGSRRAQAAKDYIVSRGIAESRVTIMSSGERRQIPHTAGEAGQAPNRRAVLELRIAGDGRPRQ